MKKLLLMMMCAPALLAAQGNGVKVSNLAVDAGTVTFDVSWSNTGMPALWSDTVWVWVDYNKNGVMERLPVTDATASAGTVTKVPNNDKGVWVAGNARSAGSFSATVKLFTTVKDVAGACAYASNYPPMGEYISPETVKFTGTPSYDIVLRDNNGGTETRTEDSPYTVPTGYTVQSFTDKTGAPGKELCTALGSTVNFTAFNPCSTAPTGATWTLQDTREADNIQTYKVKLMADGRIWIVQDMKFGNLCGITFSSSSADQTGKVSNIGTYYGDCTAATNTNTPPARGYLYDWAAAIQKAGAYYGSSSDSECSSTAAGTVSPNSGACQGICPVGWHIPTGSSSGEYQTLHNKGNCSSSNENCWDASSAWEGMLGGHCDNSGSLGNQGSNANYWSSTYYDNDYAYILAFCNGTSPGTINGRKSYGYAVRCVKNY